MPVFASPPKEQRKTRFFNEYKTLRFSHTHILQGTGKGQDVKVRAPVPIRS